jgi:hypothetical protein
MGVETPHLNLMLDGKLTNLPFFAPQTWHNENLASFSTVQVLHAHFSLGAFAFAFGFALVSAFALGLGLLAVVDDDGDDDDEVPTAATLLFRAMASVNDSSGLAGSIKFVRPANSRGGLLALGGGTPDSLASSSAASSSACAAPCP